MARDDTEKSKLQLDQEAFTATGKRMGLKGKDLARYVDDHMIGVGYKAQRSYVENEDDDDKPRRRWGNRSNRDDDDDDDM